MFCMLKRNHWSHTYEVADVKWLQRTQQIVNINGMPSLSPSFVWKSSRTYFKNLQDNSWQWNYIQAGGAASMSRLLLQLSSQMIFVLMSHSTIQWIMTIWAHHFLLKKNWTWLSLQSLKSGFSLFQRLCISQPSTFPSSLPLPTFLFLANELWLQCPGSCKLSIVLLVCLVVVLFWTVMLLPILVVMHPKITMGLTALGGSHFLDVMYHLYLLETQPSCIWLEWCSW